MKHKWNWMPRGKKQKEELLKSLSKEVREEAEYILKGEHGLMPITSNRIEVVWVNKCGYGRKAIMSVTKEGREEFEKVMEFCKKQYNLNKSEEVGHGIPPKPKGRGIQGR